MKFKVVPVASPWDKIKARFFSILDKISVGTSLFLFEIAERSRSAVATYAAYHITVFILSYIFASLWFDRGVVGRSIAYDVIGIVLVVVLTQMFFYFYRAQKKHAFIENVPEEVKNEEIEEMFKGYISLLGISKGERERMKKMVNNYKLALMYHKKAKELHRQNSELSKIEPIKEFYEISEEQLDLVEKSLDEVKKTLLRFNSVSVLERELIASAIEFFRNISISLYMREKILSLVGKKSPRLAYYILGITKGFNYN